MHKQQAILLLAILIVSIVAVYYVQEFWKKKIKPATSLKHFFLYVAASFASVFALVLVFGVLILHFKEFFFKQ